jgi:hypothetical protein
MLPTGAHRLADVAHRFRPSPLIPALSMRPIRTSTDSALPGRAKFGDALWSSVRPTVKDVISVAKQVQRRDPFEAQARHQIKCDISDCADSR